MIHNYYENGTTTDTTKPFQKPWQNQNQLQLKSCDLNLLKQYLSDIFVHLLPHIGCGSDSITSRCDWYKWITDAIAGLFGGNNNTTTTTTTTSTSTTTTKCGCILGGGLIDCAEATTTPTTVAPTTIKCGGLLGGGLLLVIEWNPNKVQECLI